VWETASRRCTGHACVWQCAGNIRGYDGIMLSRMSTLERHSSSEHVEELRSMCLMLHFPNMPCALPSAVLEQRVCSGTVYASQLELRMYRR